MHPAHLIQLIMARRQMHSGSGKTVLIRICIRSIASVIIALGHGQSDLGRTALGQKVQICILHQHYLHRLQTQMAQSLWKRVHLAGLTITIVIHTAL
jgi:hypothetical protein